MRVRHAEEVALDVRQASEEAKPLVRRLLELNAYEFSAIDGRDIGADGEYGYPYLDRYCGASNDRAAFLFHVDAQLAGFALVRLGTPHQVAEFLVLPKYRRNGLGTAAARQILSVGTGNGSRTRFPATMVPWRSGGVRYPFTSLRPRMPRARPNNS
jgi:GNAT superfamily N-acetyltransferase